VNLYRVPTSPGFHSEVFDRDKRRRVRTSMLFMHHESWDSRRFFVVPVVSAVQYVAREWF